MNRTNRRTMLQLATLAALAPACVIPARASTTDQLIAPPSGQMRYCRSVVRDMADGSHFTVCRQFLVDFRQFAGGFMMHGTQESVSADAPAALAQYAAMEEARDESGLFPIALDPYGQILSADVATNARDDVRHAVDHALAEMSRQPIAPEDRAALAAYVSALQLASQRVTAHLPVDLFAPSPAPRYRASATGVPARRGGPCGQQLWRRPRPGNGPDAQCRARSPDHGRRLQQTFARRVDTRRALTPIQTVAVLFYLSAKPRNRLTCGR